jgi:hypothetical protein
LVSNSILLIIELAYLASTLELVKSIKVFGSKVAFNAKVLGFKSKLPSVTTSESSICSAVKSIFAFSLFIAIP